MWEVTKIFNDIAIAHRIPGHTGKCALLHGHDLKLEVTLCGDVLNDIDVVVDFSFIKRVVEREIVIFLDHKNLNECLLFNPTAENLAKWIYETIDKVLREGDIRVKEVILWESSTSKVKYYE